MTMLNARRTRTPEVFAPVNSFATLDLHYRFSERLRFDLHGRNLLDSTQVQTSGPRTTRPVLRA